MASTVIMPNYTIGEDAYAEIAPASRGLGTKLFAIGGKTAMEKALPALRQALAGSGLTLLDAVWYGGECTYAAIRARAAEAKAAGAEIILGIGGGKALDTAKGAAHELGLPVFTLPTIAATCAATTALSVVYDENHVFDSFYFYDAPARHCFINTAVIAAAPVQYLRAGIGDTLAKHYECTLASRGDALNHSSGLAVNISRMCRDPLLTYGKEALESCREGRISNALEQVVLANIVSTGLVSFLVDEAYNGAIAHSLFYGLTLLEHFEERFLHGDVVGYGILVQLLIDHQEEEFWLLRSFFSEIGIPLCLADVEVPLDRALLEPVLDETLRGPDMEHLPYPVTKEMLWQAICTAEAANLA